jgi:creatinine amidohydrolase
MGRIAMPFFAPIRRRRSKMIREWELASTNLRRIRRRRYEVAVIPVGATEAHNLHLPEGQDLFMVEAIARESCRRAWSKCPRVICLPAIPYGVDCNLMDFPLTMHVRQSSLDAIVRDLIEGLHKHGIRKVALFNGHGGNNFLPLVRQVQCDLDSHVFLCNVWEVGHDEYARIFATPDDHAGEMETSIALELWPDLVEMAAARNAKARPFRFEAMTRGWVKTSRTFSKLNDLCAVGDPRAATARKGKRYLELTCSRLGRFLAELAAAKIDRTFPQRLK